MHFCRALNCYICSKYCWKYLENSGEILHAGCKSMGSKGPIPRLDEIRDNQPATKQNLSQGQGTIIGTDELTWVPFWQPIHLVKYNENGH